MDSELRNITLFVWSKYLSNQIKPNIQVRSSMYAPSFVKNLLFGQTFETDKQRITYIKAGICRQNELTKKEFDLKCSSLPTTLLTTSKQTTKLEGVSKVGSNQEQKENSWKIIKKALLTFKSIPTQKQLKEKTGLGKNTIERNWTKIKSNYLYIMEENNKKTEKDPFDIEIKPTEANEKIGEYKVTYSDVEYTVCTKWTISWNNNKKPDKHDTRTNIKVG